MPTKARHFAPVLPSASTGLCTVLATALAALCAASPAWGQAPQLSPQTQQFVKYAQPLLAITHVRVIDGNGTTAKENQTVLLRDGLIEIGRASCRERV